MRFGINFFPTVGPGEKSAAQYYDECLELCVRADRLGYSSLKIVEHYFSPYGGYSPDPVTFLSAAAVSTTRTRLVTGAVIPAFSHPIKLAAKLAMLDNISHGRLDIGCGRAFLPTEFDAFQIPLDESRARFEEGIAAMHCLWTGNDVSWTGRFYQFGPVTLLPRPFQQPHPPIWIAATFSPESYAWAGRHGYNLMIVPFVSSHENVVRLVQLYRASWREADHAVGEEQVQISFHLYLAETSAAAHEEARVHYGDYVAKMLSAVDSWATRRSSAYEGYQNAPTALRAASYEQAVADTKIIVGDPDDVAAQVALLREYYGDVELSLQLNFGNIALPAAVRTLELFAHEVMPRFAGTLRTAHSPNHELVTQSVPGTNGRRSNQTVDC